MERLQNVALFIGAHPDDIELGAGGTVCKLRKSGWDVWFFILTLPKSEDGPAGGLSRKSEALAGASELDVAPDRVRFLGFPDQNLGDQQSEHIGSILALVRLLFHDALPALIFTHTHDDAHQDHRAAADIVNTAFKCPCLQFGVFTSTRPEFMGQVQIVVDTSETFVAKQQAFRKHESQRDLYFGKALNEVANLDQAVGRIHNFTTAEAFKLQLRMTSLPEDLDPSLNLSNSILWCNTRLVIQLKTFPTWRSFNLDARIQELQGSKQTFCAQTSKKSKSGTPAPVYSPYRVSWNGQVDPHWWTCDEWKAQYPLCELKTQVVGHTMLEKEPEHRRHYPQNLIIYVLERYAPSAKQMTFSHSRYGELSDLGHISQNKRNLSPQTILQLAQRPTPGGFVCVTVVEKPEARTFDLLYAVRKQALVNYKGSFSTLPRFFHRPFGQERRWSTAESRPERCIAAEFFKELFNRELLTEERVENWSECIRHEAHLTSAGVNSSTGHFEFGVLVVLTDKMRQKWNELNNWVKSKEWDFNALLEHEDRDVKQIPLNAERLPDLKALLQEEWASGTVPAIVGSVRHLKQIFPEYDLVELGPYEEWTEQTTTS